MTKRAVLGAFVILISLIYFAHGSAVAEAPKENLIEDGPLYPKCPCPRILWEVEGSDGAIYSNPCEFECARKSPYGQRVKLTRKKRGR